MANWCNEATHQVDSSLITAYVLLLSYVDIYQWLILKIPTRLILSLIYFWPLFTYQSAFPFHATLINRGGYKLPHASSETCEASQHLFKLLIMQLHKASKLMQSIIQHLANTWAYRLGMQQLYLVYRGISVSHILLKWPRTAYRVQLNRKR